MSNKIHWIITDHNITVSWEGDKGWQTHTVPRSDALANDLIKAMKEKRLDDIPELVSAAKRIEKYSDGKFVVEDGQILINGIPAPAILGGKILRFSEEGLPYEPLVKFAGNLQKNPSYRSVNELYQFLEKNDHPITENGNFIAYKKVRKDFLDVHSGTFDNSPGKVIEMPRNQVNEDSTQTCSAGLHVANFSYAKDFYGGGQMLEVEVNPADVVSIPVDYNQSKMRVCKYKVLGVVDCEVSDTSLRVTGSSEGWTVNEVDEDETEEEATCSECGEVLCCDEELCDECHSAQEEEDEEEDRYPFEDEIE